jgi:hypothetical protein
LPALLRRDKLLVHVKQRGTSMATASTCVKCGASSFELGEIEVRGATAKLYAVRCAKCGGVVGLSEPNDTGSLLAAQNDALNKIAKAVNAEDVNLNT